MVKCSLNSGDFKTNSMNKNKEFIPFGGFIRHLPNGTNLNQDQIDWALSVGIKSEKAQWLASCPAGTKCGSDYIKHTREPKPDAFLYKSDKGKIWYLRIKRNKKLLMIRLHSDKETARELRNEKLKELGISLTYNSRMPKSSHPMSA